MSWFSELTSRAEAMLVKLDQEAAQALLDEKDQRDIVYPDSEPDSSPTDENSAGILNSSEQIKTSNQAFVNIPAKTTITNSTTHDNTVSQRNETASHTFDQSGNNQSLIQQHGSAISEYDDTPKTEPKNGLSNKGASNKFTLKTGPQPFAHSSKRAKRNTQSRNGISRKTIIETEIGADDIRANINRSLLDYASQNNQSDITQTTSYYDDNPTIIRHTNQLDDHNDEMINKRLTSSPSFSINLPDNLAHDQGFIASSSPVDDIASRLRKLTSAKRKSTYYLHNVMNRLASANGPAATIFANQLRLKCQRFQMFAVNHARQLNYHFKAYPRLKYAALASLALMHILIIYVLFFYQSSGSTTRLSSEIKQQQADSIVASIESNEGQHPLARSLRSVRVYNQT